MFRNVPCSGAGYKLSCLIEQELATPFSLDALLHRHSHSVWLVPGRKKNLPFDIAAENAKNLVYQHVCMYIY